ncbi:hypothetical protein HAX54_042045 [Datura stramonium]|uniref:Uncharacterized protein n=1 Tax=Datura stramonium TaxID=4076 RepID=A0ABS8SLS6_DATST|nr:hypothetical protein [Datura stramonium]
MDNQLKNNNSQQTPINWEQVVVNQNSQAPQTWPEFVGDVMKFEFQNWQCNLEHADERRTIVQPISSTNKHSSAKFNLNGKTSASTFGQGCVASPAAEEINFQCNIIQSEVNNNQEKISPHDLCPKDSNLQIKNGEGIISQCPSGVTVPAAVNGGTKSKIINKQYTKHTNATNFHSDAIVGQNIPASTAQALKESGKSLNFSNSIPKGTNNLRNVVVHLQSNAIEQKSAALNNLSHSTKDGSKSPKKRIKSLKSKISITPGQSTPNQNQNLIADLPLEALEQMHMLSTTQEQNPVQAQIQQDGGEHILGYQSLVSIENQNLGTDLGQASEVDRYQISGAKQGQNFPISNQRGVKNIQSLVKGSDTILNGKILHQIGAGHGNQVQQSVVQHDIHEQQVEKGYEQIHLYLQRTPTRANDQDQSNNSKSKNKLSKKRRDSLKKKLEAQNREAQVNPNLMIEEINISSPSQGMDNQNNTVESQKSKTSLTDVAR